MPRLKTLITLLRRFSAGASGPLLAGTLVSLVLGFVTSALQARLLGPDGRGELASAIVPGALMALLLCWNLPDYYGTRAASTDDSRVLSTRASGTALIAWIASIPPFVILAFLVAPFGSDAWWVVIAFACAGWPNFLGYSLVGVAAGSGLWGTVAVARAAPSIGTAAGLIAAFVLNWSVLGVGLVLVAASVAGPLTVLAHRELRPRLRGAMTGTRAAFSFGLRAWPASTLNLLSQRLDVVVISLIASNRQAGLYVVASGLAAILGALVNAVAVPARNAAALDDALGVARVLRLCLLGATTAFVVALVVLPWAVPLVYGREFSGAVGLANLLLAAQIPIAAVIVISLALIGRGRPAAPLWGAVTGLALSAGMMVALYPILGPPGIAVAVIAGNMINAAVLLRKLRSSFPSVTIAVLILGGRYRRVSGD